MDDDVLLHDALIVAAPGEERDVVAAPGAELLERLAEADAVGQTLPVEAGELFHLVMHPLEIHRLDVDLKFVARRHIVVEPHCADLDDLPAQMDRQLVEDGGFGTHRLIPFHIHHDIVHRMTIPFV